MGRIFREFLSVPIIIRVFASRSSRSDYAHDVLPPPLAARGAGKKNRGSSARRLRRRARVLAVYAAAPHLGAPPPLTFRGPSSGSSAVGRTVHLFRIRPRPSPAGQCFIWGIMIAPAKPPYRKCAVNPGRRDKPFMTNTGGVAATSPGPQRPVPPPQFRASSGLSAARGTRADREDRATS